MKKTIISITILLASLLSVSSQSVHSLYFLNEWSQRHTLNAAFAPEYGYFSLPVLGGVDLSLSSNLGMNNFLYPYNSQYVTFLHPSVDPQTFINGLSPDNYLKQAMNLNLFSFGFYTRENSFWSFDITLKENMNVNLPIDFFRFLKLGMANTTNNTYDLKNLGIEQTNTAQVSLGYSRDILPNLRVGVNAKVLVGLSSERINYSKFDISLAQNQFGIDAVGQSTIMSSFMSFPKDANNYYDFSKPNISTSQLIPAGYGFAVDLGVTYKPFHNLTLAVALNDLGFMRWDRTSITNGVATGNVAFNGFSNIDISNINIQSQIDSLTSSMNNMIKFKAAPANDDIVENIPYNFNASAEYSIFGNDKHDVLVGVLFHSYNTATTNVNEVVAALTLKPLSWFTLSATCDLLNTDFNRYGLALNLSPSWINLYIASDFVTPKLNPQYFPIDKINLNLIFGGSFVIGRPAKHVKPSSDNL